MKKLIFVLLAGSLAMTSCNKETSLANKLEDKWDITTLVFDSNDLVDYIGADGVSDSTKTNPWDDANITTVTTVTGTVDFVSEDNLIMKMNVKTVATVKNSDGTSSVFTDEFDEEDASEYFATGEDEITLIDSDGGFTVFKVLTNEKDQQVWESTDVDVDEDSSSFPKVVTTTTTVTTLTINKQD